MALKLECGYLKGFIGEHEYAAMASQVESAHALLASGKGPGNDFLGWVDLPTNYDKEEFARIKAAAERIKKNTDVFIVIGIGGSYLGARAAIEFLKSEHYNALKKDTPDIYFTGNSISSTALAELVEICEGKDISINMISKSGTTTEPAVAFRVFKGLLEEKYGKEEARRRTAHVEVQEGRVTLSLRALGEAPDAVRPRMLLRLFDLLGVGRRDIGAVHLRAMMTMARNTAWSKEGRLDLPHGVTARYCRGWLLLETRPQPLSEVQPLPGQSFRWGDYTLTLLDLPSGEGLALRPPAAGEVLTVAPVIAGERLALPGSRGSRSVKRLCLDRGISLRQRDRLPAVYVGGRLAAVWRLGVDMEFLPGGVPCRFIQIRENKEGGHP